MGWFKQLLCKHASARTSKGLYTRFNRADVAVEGGIKMTTSCPHCGWFRVTHRPTWRKP